MVLPDRRSWPRWARAATSGWVLSPLLVLALLAGAFFGYGAWTRSQPTHYARGGGFTLNTLPHRGPTATPGGAGSHRKHNAAGAVASVGLPGTTVTQPGTGSTPAVGPSSAPGPAEHSGGKGPRGDLQPPSPSRPAVPAAGEYALDVTGGEHVSFGPFAACHKSFPARGLLSIARAAGETPTSYDFDLRLYPGSTGQHDERHIYRYEPTGVYLDFEQATVTCAGVRQSSKVDYHPAQTRVQLPLEVGASWRSKGGDSSRTESEHSTVTGTTHLDVAGHRYLVYVIDTSVTMTGSESGTRTQRWWYSPDLAMPLKWHEELSGSRSGAKYSETMTARVVSLP